MSPAALGRLAGLTYLVLILVGVFGMVYVPMTLFVWDDPAATAARVAERATLLRLGMAACFVSYLALVVLSALLARLAAPVAGRGAWLLLAVGVVAAAAYGSNVMNLAEGLAQAEAWAGAAPNGRPAIADTMRMAFESFHPGTLRAYGLTALWLVVLAALVWRTRFVPRAFAPALMAAALSYAVGFAGVAIVPGWEPPSWFGTLDLLGTAGEFGFCLWLLAAGARSPRG